MQNKHRWTVITALVALAVVAGLVGGCGGENNTPPVPTMGTVTGKVVDYYSGVGLGGTTITVGGKSAVSTSSGTFVVGDVPEGTYTVTITPPAGLVLPSGSQAVVVTVFAGQTTTITDNIILMDENDVPPNPPGS